jgi:hypothetical protein
MPTTPSPSNSDSDSKARRDVAAWLDANVDDRGRSADVGELLVATLDALFVRARVSLGHDLAVRVFDRAIAGVRERHPLLDRLVVPKGPETPFAWAAFSLRGELGRTKIPGHELASARRRSDVPSVEE